MDLNILNEPMGSIMEERKLINNLGDKEWHLTKLTNAWLDGTSCLVGYWNEMKKEKEKKYNVLMELVLPFWSKRESVFKYLMY